MKQLLFIFCLFLAATTMAQNGPTIVIKGAVGGAALPAQTGQAGKILMTDGTTTTWVTPAQYLLTNPQNGDILVYNNGVWINQPNTGGGGEPGNITPAAPTAGVVDDVNNTFNWTYTSGYTAATDYEYTLNGGTSYTPVTVKPIAIGNVALAAGQVGVRVEAATGRNASPTLFSTSAFTTTAPPAGTPLVWTQLSGATDDGNGTISISEAGSGGTATVHMGPSGSQAGFVVPPTIADGNAVALVLSITNDALYSWSTHINGKANTRATLYLVGSSMYYQIGQSTTGVNLGATVPGDVWIMEKSGTDLIFKKNGTQVGTTQTGILTSTVYIKAVSASAAGKLYQAFGNNLTSN